MYATVKSVMKINLKNRSQLLVFIIGIYTMLFEWRSIFERPYFIFTANLLKFFIPVLFLLLILATKKYFKYSALKSYILFFILFMVWALISSLFSSKLNECVIHWAKYIPLFLFCFFICLYMQKNGYIKGMLMKFFIWIAVLTVIQYGVLTIVSFYGPVERFSNPKFLVNTYRGPFGLLGQGQGSVYFSPINLSLFQLYGFWMEPSKAAGFLLTSAFFAEIIFLQTKQRVWKLAKFVCFIGCVVTFSNTAYLCISMVGLLGGLFYLKTNKNRRFFNLIIVLFFIVLAFFAVFGRYFVAKYHSDNSDLRYIVGVRESIKNPYGGRIELFKSNLADVGARPLLGVGCQIPGKNKQGDGYTVSSHALGYWLTFTGVIGLMFLMLREFQIIKIVAKNVFLSVYILRVSQAWLAFFVANFLYLDGHL